MQSLRRQLPERHERDGGFWRRHRASFDRVASACMCGARIVFRAHAHRHVARVHTRHPRAVPLRMSLARAQSQEHCVLWQTLTTRQKGPRQRSSRIAYHIRYAYTISSRCTLYGSDHAFAFATRRDGRHDAAAADATHTLSHPNLMDSADELLTYGS